MSHPDPDIAAFFEVQRARGECHPLAHTQLTFDQAKTWLLRRHPFYGSFLLSLEQEWSWSVPTAGTDGVKIMYNPEACCDFASKQWRFLFVHEIEHVAHLHAFRRKNKDPMLWNVACDIIINELILADGDFEATPGILLPVDDPKTGMKWAKYSGQSPEWVYKDLYDNAKKIAMPAPGQGTQSQGTPDQSQPGSGQGGQGGDPKGPAQAGSQLGADGKLDAGKLGDRTTGGTQAGKEVRHVKIDWLHGDVLPPADLDEQGMEEARRKAEHLRATATFHARAMGKANDSAVVEPGQRQRSWQLELNEFVSQVIDKDDYSWAKPNRRYVPQGIYYPTLTGQAKPKLMALAVDISVSISVDQLNLMLEELGALLASHTNLSFEVYFVNTQITHQRRVSAEDLPLAFDVQGCGGTDFRPAFVDIEEKGLPIDGMIYFTDLECNRYAIEPEFPVIWLNFDQPCNPGDNWHPPYGKVVNMV